MNATDAYEDVTLCDVCGKETCEDLSHVPPGDDHSPASAGPHDAIDEAPTFIDDARTLADAAAVAEPIPALIDGFMLAACTWLLHGDWRSLKTWVLLEMLIAGATQTPVFGLLAVPRRFRSHLITNEDGAGRLGERIGALCRGRGVDLEHGAIGVSAHRGVWMDDAVWLARILAAIRDDDRQVLALDPLRSVTGAVDQGPREFQPFARLARRIVSDTGAAFAQTHHDTKPPVGQTDTRRRGHRASGGGLLSAADCPIHAERIGEEPRVILTPAAWKHAGDPPPIEVTLETEERGGKLWTARLVGRHVSATSSGQSVLMGRIRTVLAESPGLSGSAVATRVKSNKQAVLQALAAMQASGECESYASGRRGAATAWILSPKELAS